MEYGVIQFCVKILHTILECLDRSLPLSNQEEDGGGGGGKDYMAKLPLDRKMYFQYYVQDDADAGTLMDTKIPISEVGLRQRLCV